MLHQHYCILLMSTCFLLLFQGCHTGDYLQIANAQSCKPYEIIKDDLGIFIEVVVYEKTTEEELKCILVEVANKHQSDKARDYLWSEYLWVEIYLRKKDNTISHNSCGKLRRFVPRKNSTNTTNTENDSFFFSVDECFEL